LLPGALLHGVAFLSTLAYVHTRSHALRIFMSLFINVHSLNIATGTVCVIYKAVCYFGTKTVLQSTMRRGIIKKNNTTFNQRHFEQLFLLLRLLIKLKPHINFVKVEVSVRGMIHGRFELNPDFPRR